MATLDVSGFLRQSVEDGLGPIIVTESEARQKYDYEIPGGGSAYEVRYIGEAPQGTTDGDEDWIVRRLTWTMFGSVAKVTDIQTLTGSWTNRASLPWS